MDWLTEYPKRLFKELRWSGTDPERLAIGEMVASQLPGRQNGGAADAYRYILLAAGGIWADSCF